MIAGTRPNFKGRKLDIKLSCIDVLDIFLAAVDDVFSRKHIVFAVDDVLGPAGLRLARSAIMTRMPDNLFAAPHIPEPAVLSLPGSGGLTLLRRRRVS